MSIVSRRLDSRSRADQSAKASSAERPRDMAANTKGEGPALTSDWVS
jgi:hypothetical protein